MTTLLQDTARAFAAAGCSVVPARTDGSKAPAAFWKQYQQHRPEPPELDAWFTGGHYDGLGIITGAVSGHLEMFEVEGHAIHLLPELAGLLNDNGLADLWRRLNTGYLEASPSGGLHWLYRVDGTARPNTKLARRLATPEELAENPGEKIKVLIETRGEGGFTITAPSAGRTHPTGKPWTLAVGSPATIPTITVDERDALHAIASLLDAMPTDVDQPRPAVSHDPTRDGIRPGDDYNTRATWDDILGPHGWIRARAFGGNCYGWRRPGKTDPGISATTGRNDADNLYVFTTSTDFVTEKPYSKFGAYTLLEHGGDYTAAARALRAQGYGSEPHRTTSAELHQLVPGTHGNLATVTPLPTPDQRRLRPVEERTFARSDDGNALALVERFGDVIRYCPQRGRWLAWDGVRWQWQPVAGGTVREYAKRIARALPETDQGAVSHKRRSLGAIGTSAMLTQAATDARITVDIVDLDAHPWDLNTPAGIVDLRTGHLGPPDPARLHTRVTATAPDFDADETFWAAFLADTFASDHVLTGYLQRLVGYSAVGLVGPHVLPFCFGSGGNGKGAFLEAVTKVLGDYATTAPVGFLMAHAHASHETELARLAGARMVLCSEVNEDDRFDEAKVKQLTGGDTITARFMRQDHFTFAATHQLWLVGNSQPAVRTGGRAFWRRLRLVPFTHEVPEDKVIDDLQGILARDHGPVLLAWIARGAAAYAAGGLCDPESVKAATAAYAHDQDTVARFVDERCHIGGGEHVQVKVAIVRTAYEQWCAEAGETPVTAKAFGMQLARHGVESRRTKAARMYVGITLLADENEEGERE